MVKLLIYSKNPITNYNKVKSLCLSYLIISLLISIIVFFSKGFIHCIITFLFLLFIIIIEFYIAKACLTEKNTLILEKAYNNGKRINFIMKILLCLFWIYLFGLLYGSILSLITIIGQLLIIKE